MSLTTVLQAFSPAEAQLARSRLEAAGFQVFVQHELSSIVNEGYSAAAGGILVQVPDEQAADARQLLESTEPEPE